MTKVSVPLSADLIEFLEDHPMAQAVVRGMMRKAATTGDDPKQVAKLCKECSGFDGEHRENCSHKVSQCHLKPQS
jgi:hypothetical protein